MPKPIKPPVPSDDDAPPVETGAVGRQREETIRAGVLKALGRPAGLLRVAVMPLWSNHFRVNIVTGSDPTTVNIPNSYFVTADDSGAILRTTPPILKQY